MLFLIFGKDTFNCATTFCSCSTLFKVFLFVCRGWTTEGFFTLFCKRLIFFATILKSATWTSTEYPFSLEIEIDLHLHSFISQNRVSQRACYLPNDHKTFG